MASATASSTGATGRVVEADHIPRLAEAGVTGFKIFMIGGGYPHDDRIAVVGRGALRRVRRDREDRPAPQLHPFEQELFDHFARASSPRASRPITSPSPRSTRHDIVWRTAVARSSSSRRRPTSASSCSTATHREPPPDPRGQGGGPAGDRGDRPQVLPPYREDLESGAALPPGRHVTEDPERMRRSGPRSTTGPSTSSTPTTRRTRSRTSSASTDPGRARWAARSTSMCCR